jgi:4'-phosphopantetheinyl transferase
MNETSFDNADSWLPAPEHPHVSRSEVHIWRASLAQPAIKIEALQEVLSDDERERASKFRFKKDQSNFIVARGVLRLILGRYLRLPPEQLRFDYNSYGKPDLHAELGERLLRFNLSHAGGLALYVITGGREVGVDIEILRDDVDGVGIAEHFFSPGEIKTLCALPPEVQTRAFFNCWTRKESYIKARGAGLSIPLERFDVSLSPCEPAALLSTLDDKREASRWLLRELSPGPDYVAAVAVEGGGWQLRCWQWS